MAKILKNVSWKRIYPMRMESDELVLIRRGYMFELIYEVFLSKTNESLGTVSVKENVSLKAQKNRTECSKYKLENMKYVVLERFSRTELLKKRIKDIQDIIYENF